MPTIAIIGGGTGGNLLAARLLEASTDGQRLQVMLIEARGRAAGSPAGGRQPGERAAPGAFLTRMRGEVIGVDEAGGGLRVWLRSGRVLGRGRSGGRDRERRRLPARLGRAAAAGSICCPRMPRRTSSTRRLTRSRGGAVGARRPGGGTAERQRRLRPRATARDYPGLTTRATARAWRLPAEFPSSAPPSSTTNAWPLTLRVLPVPRRAGESGAPAARPHAGRPCVGPLDGRAAGHGTRTAPRAGGTRR